MDYCNSLLYGIPEYQTRKLQRVLNASAKLNYRAPKFCHITPLLAELHWLPMRARIHYKILLIIYKILHGHAPKYLSDLISIQQLLCYSFRRNDNDPLLKRLIAKTKKTMGDRSFQIVAPLLWNKLPRSAREARNLESFKTIIKTFYTRNHFSYLSNFLLSISLLEVLSTVVIILC